MIMNFPKDMVVGPAFVFFVIGALVVSAFVILMVYLDQ